MRSEAWNRDVWAIGITTTSRVEGATDRRGQLIDIPRMHHSAIGLEVAKGICAVAVDA